MLVAVTICNSFVMLYKIQFILTDSDRQPPPWTRQTRLTCELDIETPESESSECWSPIKPSEEIWR